MLPHTQPRSTLDPAAPGPPSGSDGGGAGPAPSAKADRRRRALFGGDAPRQLRREDFEAARGRTAPHLHRTPLLSFRTLGDRTGGPALLKCESLQKTGSFKVRGALNAVACLSRAERARGVATVSAGNHAQAVAWAARRHGTRAVVVMPEAASRTKIAAATGYGAEVALHGSAADAFREARRRAESEGLVFLHPFDCERVVEGHGSVGLELAEDVTGPAAIVAPVGGGGQIAGIAGALAALDRLGLGDGDRAGGGGTGADGRSGGSPASLAPASPPGAGARRLRVFGVEPEGAPAMRRSLDEGRAVELRQVRTVADGLAPPMAGALAYRYVAAFVEDVVLVSDEEIMSAVRLLLGRAKLVAEPSGAAAVAALMFGRIPLAPGETAVAVVSGGNADPELLARALREGTP